MTSLIADDAMLAVLRQAAGLAEIRDTRGEVVGFFAPVSLEQARRYAEAAARIDRAELERRKQSGEKGVELHVILGRLKQLEDEIERRKAAGERAFTTDEAMAYYRSLREEAARSAQPA
jgi:hypothetical protein